MNNTLQTVCKSPRRLEGVGGGGGGGGGGGRASEEVRRREDNTAMN